MAGLLPRPICVYDFITRSESQQARIDLRCGFKSYLTFAARELDSEATSCGWSRFFPELSGDSGAGSCPDFDSADLSSANRRTANTIPVTSQSTMTTSPSP